jgi:TonB family protein
MVQVQVTAQGQPRSVVITRSSGITRLDTAAIKACHSAHYLPAMKNGRATDSTFCFEVCFQLQSGS